VDIEGQAYLQECEPWVLEKAAAGGGERVGWPHPDQRGVQLFQLYNLLSIAQALLAPASAAGGVAAVCLAARATVL